MTLNTGQPHVNEEQRPADNNCNIRFPNQMIEQINIALEQKVREFLSWSHWSLPMEITSEKRACIGELKLMKNEHPAFFPRTGRYCKFLITRGIALIGAVTALCSDRLRVGSVTD